MAILVVTDDEWAAARRIFPAMRQIADTPYYSPDPAMGTGVVLRKLPDRGTLCAFETTLALLEDFRPSFAFLFGTGGGVSRDGIKLGDVVIADHMENSAFHKIVPRNSAWWTRLLGTSRGGYRYRYTPIDQPSLYLRDNFGQPRREPQSTWRGRIQAHRPDNLELVVHCGQVLSGDTIFSAPDSEEQRAALAHFDKALVVETEGHGFARAMFYARIDPWYNPLYFVARGISDMIDGGSAETERKGWTPYAAEAAGRLVADIAYELLLRHPL